MHLKQLLSNKTYQMLLAGKIESVTCQVFDFVKWKAFSSVSDSSSFLKVKCCLLVEMHRNGSCSMGGGQCLVWPSPDWGLCGPEGRGPLWPRVVKPFCSRGVGSAQLSPSWAAATGAAASPGVVEPERPQLLFPGQLSWEAQGSLDLVETGRKEVQPRTPPSPSAFQPQMKSHLWRLTPQSVYVLSWVPWCSWKVPRGREFLFPAVAADTASAVGCVTGLIFCWGWPWKAGSPRISCSLSFALSWAHPLLTWWGDRNLLGLEVVALNLEFSELPMIQTGVCPTCMWGHWVCGKHSCVVLQQPPASLSCVMFCSELENREE